MSSFSHAEYSFVGNAVYMTTGHRYFKNSGSFANFNIRLFPVARPDATG